MCCVGHNVDRNRYTAVPEVIKTVRGIVADRAYADNINVLKVDVGQCEVFVTDVAPAGNQRLVVGHNQLVVHTIVDAPELAELAEHFQPLAAQAQRVVKAHLDIGVNIHRGNPAIFQLGADIINQQTHSHAAIGSLEQVLGNQSTRYIGVVDIVLDIQALLGHVDQPNTRGQGIGAVVQENKARLPTAVCLPGADITTQRRVFIAWQVIARQFLVTMACGGAANDQCGQADQK